MAVLRCPKKKLQKLLFFHSSRFKSSLEHRLKNFPFLNTSIWFRTSSYGLKSLKNLNLSTALIHSELPMTDTLGLVAMPHVQNPLKGDPCFFRHFLVMNEWTVPWAPLWILFCMGWFSPCPSQLRGFWTCSVATHPRARAIGSSLWRRAVPQKC